MAGRSINDASQSPSWRVDAISPSMSHAQQHAGLPNSIRQLVMCTHCWLARFITLRGLLLPIPPGPSGRVDKVDDRTGRTAC